MSRKKRRRPASSEPPQHDLPQSEQPILNDLSKLGRNRNEISADDGPPRHETTNVDEPAADARFGPEDLAERMSDIPDEPGLAPHTKISLGIAFAFACMFGLMLINRFTKEEEPSASDRASAEEATSEGGSSDNGQASKSSNMASDPFTTRGGRVTVPRKERASRNASDRKTLAHLEQRPDVAPPAWSREQTERIPAYPKPPPFPQTEIRLVSPSLAEENRAEHDAESSGRWNGLDRDRSPLQTSPERADRPPDPLTEAPDRFESSYAGRYAKAFADRFGVGDEALEVRTTTSAEPEPAASRASSGMLGSAPPVPVVQPPSFVVPKVPEPPSASALLPASRTPEPEQRPWGAAVGGPSYVVKQGDTLFDVARSELGKAVHWLDIYELNREVVGNDIENLTPGTRLILPAQRAVERNDVPRRR